MARIFVSHSKHDVTVVNFFTRAFATSKNAVKADFMEFEDLEGKYAGREIAQRITNPETQAVFVLLGPGVRSALHTENWVTFEVGVASGVGKDVWVFEHLVDNIEFPVPYLNHYVMYQTDNIAYLQFIRNMIDAYSIFPLFRNTIIFGHKPSHIKCIRCNAEYFLHTPIEQFPCPCCRTQLRPAVDTGLPVQT